MNDEGAIRVTFTKQELMRTLGAALGRVAPGEVVAATMLGTMIQRKNAGA